jgi:tripartite-type tricarboxylate transporter receptor subunit TctC
MRIAMTGCLQLIGLAIGLFVAGAQAQETFPARPLKVVIPYPAGGGTDTIGRLVADQLSRMWKQTVVVENIGGAAGNVGAAQVFKSAPDGHTLMITSPGPVATNAFLYKDMPFDSARWTSIALLATGPYVLVVSNKFGITTVKDLVARGKANPGKITAATPGAGSVGHLATVQLEMLGGFKSTLVPYRGLSPAVNDLIAGHVDLMFDTPTTSLPLHRGGKVKIIATGTPERVKDYADIPTIAETLPGYRSVTWYAMVAPPAMPAALADRINRDVNEILGRPDVAERVRGIQMDPATKSRAEAAKFLDEERALWGKVIKQANIVPQ